MNYIFLMFLMACMGQKEKQQITDSSSDEESIACGFNPNEYACDFTFFDQNDKKVSLYDFKGKTILLDISTMWCYYCNVAAMQENEIMERYKDEDFVWVTVLVQDKKGNKPSCSDLKEWASQYKIDQPILSGDDSILDFEDDGIDVGYKCGGYPTFVLINELMYIEHYMFGWSSEGIKKLLDDYFSTKE